MASLRALLTLSISSLMISCVLMLVFGLKHEGVAGIMWFSVMGSVLIYYFSILAIVGLTIYYKVKKEKAWNRIKKESLLLGLSLFCFLILGWIANM